MDAGSFEEMQAKQQQMVEMQERREMILEQILEPGAKERLTRLGMTRKDKARMVEDSLLAAATNGRLKGKVTEEALIQMLEQFSGHEGSDGKPKKGIVIQRRKSSVDDEDDDNDDDL